MNNLMILNRFYPDDLLICHKGKPIKIGRKPFVWLTFDTGNIIELKTGCLNKVALRNNKGYLIGPITNVLNDVPFIITSTKEIQEVKYIKIKYLSQLELFDIIYK